jgi:hypothetical protein
VAQNRLRSPHAQRKGLGLCIKMFGLIHIKSGYMATITKVQFEQHRLFPQERDLPNQHAVPSASAITPSLFEVPLKH